MFDSITPPDPLPEISRNLPMSIPSCQGGLERKILWKYGEFSGFGNIHLQFFGKFPTFSTNLASHFFVHHYPNFFTLNLLVIYLHQPSSHGTRRWRGINHDLLPPWSPQNNPILKRIAERPGPLSLHLKRNKPEKRLKTLKTGNKIGVNVIVQRYLRWWIIS